MEKKNIKKGIIRKNDNHRFFKMLAVFFALLAFFAIIDNPMGFIEGILDSLK